MSDPDREVEDEEVDGDEVEVEAEIDGMASELDAMKFEIDWYGAVTERLSVLCEAVRCLREGYSGDTESVDTIHSLLSAITSIADSTILANKQD
jgi:hypothetical protein